MNNECDKARIWLYDSPEFIWAPADVSKLDRMVSGLLLALVDQRYEHGRQANGGSNNGQSPIRFLEGIRL